MYKAFFIRISGFVLMYLTTIAAARLLGAEKYGVYSSVLSFSNIATVVAAFGMPVYVTKSIALIDTKDHSGAVREISHSNSVGVISSVLIIIAFTAIILLEPGFLRKYSGVMYFALLIFPLNVFIQIRQGAALSLKSASNAIFPEQIFLPVLFILFLLALSLTEAGVVENVLAVYAAAALLSLLLGYFISFDCNAIKKLLSAALETGHIRKTFSSGVPFLSSNISRILMSNADIVFVSYFIGFKEAGLYAAASRLAAMVAFPLGIINLVIMPRLARKYSENDREQLIGEARGACTITFLLSVLVCAAIAVFYGPIFRLMGAEFLEAGEVLFILLAAQVINSFFGPNGIFMQMAGLERLYSRAMMALSVAQAAAVAVAASLGGIITVAVCVAVMTLCWNIVLTFFIAVKRDIVLLPYSPFYLGRICRKYIQ